MAKITKQNTNEMYFLWWAKELMDKGYIKDIEREPETFIVDDVIKHKREKHFVRKENELEEFNLFRKLVYTYDFRIIWNEKALYYFYEIYDKYGYFKFGRPLFIAHKTDLGITSYIDVKPTSNIASRFGKTNTSVTFPYKQRLLFKNHGIYINKSVSIPMAGAGFKSALFLVSFTPKRFLLTDGGRQKRKFKWEDKTITLEEYISNFNNKYINR